MKDTVRKPGSKSRARGLERAFAILEFLRQSGEAKRPIEIATGMGAPNSSIYELIGILVNIGILERIDDHGRVFLGRRLHFLGLAYLESFDLTRLAEPLLERITANTKETSQLCMLDGDKYSVVMMHEGSRQFRISASVGERIPIPWTASGRLLLCHMSDDEILGFIPDEDFVLPDGTRLGKREFIHSVRSAQRDGYFAFDSLADTYTHCFAAPVLDSDGVCLATVCLIAPKQDARSNFDQYCNEIVRAACDLTANLGTGAVKVNSDKHFASQTSVQSGASSGHHAALDPVD